MGQVGRTSIGGDFINTNSIERIGVHHCGEILEKNGFIFREQLNCDFGIDAIIETQDADYASGKLIAVQIKSGARYFKEEKNNNIVYRGDIRHYNYWLQHSLPVVIVLYNPQTGQCVWAHVNEQTAQKLAVGWKIEIPCDQALENSTEMLEEIAGSQSEYERRLHSLVLEKDWMQIIEDGGELILEVQEWVNKSSGRGRFELCSVDETGKETSLFQRELLGFGLTKYEIVIQRLFPWANFEVDKDYYEENMDAECKQRKDATDRNLAAVYGKRGSELLRYSDKPRKIYPYRNGAGEVDFYRLKLSINQLGRSFLDLDDFLETGKSYLLGEKILKNE